MQLCFILINNLNELLTVAVVVWGGGH